MLRGKSPHGFLKKLKIFWNEGNSLKNRLNLVQTGDPGVGQEATGAGLKPFRLPPDG
jgi:hypothetical protein